MVIIPVISIVSMISIITTGITGAVAIRNRLVKLSVPFFIITMPGVTITILISIA